MALICSIQAMLRAIGRIIRARELQRTAETGIAKVPFSIYRDPRFLRVKLAVEEAVAKSAAIESAKEVMTLEVHPPMNEIGMLSQCKFSNTHPEGCNRRFVYFCLRDFCVKGRSELRELSDVDFELFTDEHGECLRSECGTLIYFEIILPWRYDFDWSKNGLLLMAVLVLMVNHGSLWKPVILSHGRGEI